MKKIIYLGRFTPTTGGVNAKNSAVFNALNKHVNINMIDLSLLKNGKILIVFSVLSALLGKKNAMIIGTAAKMIRI